MSTERIDIQVREDGSRVVRRNIEDIGASAQTASRGVGVLTEGLKGLALGIASGLSFGSLASDILKTNREMESLRARLTGVTGSIEAGKASFKFIQDFAANTPFEVEGLTKSFISLKNFGIEPTAVVMDAFTNQAAALGGSQETLNAIVLQLGQAYAKQKLQMEDIVILAERGVPIFKLLAEVTGLQGAALQEVISKGGITRDVIDQLIVKMGELATGSNARAMDTLNGKISNLSDAWHTFEDALLEDKSEGVLKNIVSGMTDTLSDFTALIKNTKISFMDLVDYVVFGSQTMKEFNAANGGGPQPFKLPDANSDLASSIKGFSSTIPFPKPKTTSTGGGTKTIKNRSRSVASKGPVFEDLDTNVIDFETVKAKHVELGRSYNDNFVAPALEKTSKLSEFGIQAARNMQSGFADFLFDPFDKGLKGMLIGFVDVFRRMAAEAASSEILNALLGNGEKGSTGLIQKGLGALFGTSVSAFASGGDSPGGIRLVGENGPELENTGPSRIFNAAQTKSILSGGGGGNVYYLTMNVQQAKNETPENTGTKMADAFVRSVARQEIAVATRAGNVLNKTTSFK